MRQAVLQLPKKTSYLILNLSSFKTHRQALIKCAKAYVNAEQEVLSIPGTSVIEDIQYAISLLNEQYKAETWPDQFKPKYDLSLAESPTK
jgi:hypothetical protein